MKQINFTKAFTFLVITVIISGCNINDPAAPEWDVNLNLPFSKKSYNIFDIINRSSNIGVDTNNNSIVFLYGESDYKRKFGEDIKFDGYPETYINAVSNIQLDTSLVIDDSTYIKKADFRNGILTFKFFNENSNQSYSVNSTIKNLFKISNNDTARIQVTVNANSNELVTFNLDEYYLENSVSSNTLKMRINFQSPVSKPVIFNYSLSEYSINSFQGRLKPLSTGISTDEVLDPFGSDVPEGEIHFASVSTDKNFLILKKFSELYRVDFSNISITGENKNGRKVRLKYLRNGNSGDPIDSVFTLTLNSDKDTAAFPINESNSNLLEFINNIPKKITLERNDILNSDYREGKVKSTDSLDIKLLIQVPLDINITEPIVFSDTADAGISDEDQRKQLDYAKNIQFNITSENRFPLKTVAGILILDSSFVPLLAISKIIGNQADSTLTVNAAPVDQNGFVNNMTLTVFSAELDSAQINSFKHMGKIIYDYKLFTDPNLIPSPLNTVKITSSNVLKVSSFGKLKYRVNF